MPSCIASLCADFQLCEKSFTFSLKNLAETDFNAAPKRPHTILQGSFLVSGDFLSCGLVCPYEAAASFQMIFVPSFKHLAQNVKLHQPDIFHVTLL